jgi:acyl dehydratase
LSDEGNGILTRKLATTLQTKYSKEVKMDYLEEMAKYHSTEKHKEFGHNFLKAEDAEAYEFWDQIEIGKETESPIKFEVKAEDNIAYAEGVPDDNALFYDEQYAKRCGHDGLVVHPFLTTQVLFFCLRKGHGSWIRTPGSRNPGQILEWHDPIRVGDILTLKTKGYDKWIKRGKYYMRYQTEIYDQNGKLKFRGFITLILPKTKEDVLRFIKGEHSLEV